MKAETRWQLMLAGILLLSSAGMYFLHWVLFRDAHHIFLYLVGDIAFLFVDVLLVMFVLHRLLVVREKRVLRKKIFMVMGTFFSEVGTELLRLVSACDGNRERQAGILAVSPAWKQKEYASARRGIPVGTTLDARQADLAALRSLLLARRQFLVGLLDNPNLLEHESFTEALWAVFHLAEELSLRESFDDLPDPDWKHLSIDIQRVHDRLTPEWLHYMEHLAGEYPYLFSLAVRTNPFLPQKSVVIRD